MAVAHTFETKCPGTGETGAGRVADHVVLDAVVEARGRSMAAATDELVAVLAWAQAHPGTPDDCASWEPGLLPAGADGLDHLGGQGTPAVAGFVVEQLAVRLHTSTGSVMQLVADTLDLAYRHPILWARVCSGACPTWTARRIAAACTTLPAEAAAWVDAEVGHLAGACAWRTVEAKIAYAVAKWDPQKTKDAEDQARDGRHVDIDLPGQGGNRATNANIAAASLRGRLSSVDGIKFDALVTAKATELAKSGDTSTLDVRRSKALGLIADQLMSGELDLGAAADPAGTGASTPKSSLPATLFVHVTLEDLLAHLDGSTGVGVVEKLGPATLDLLAEWLGQTDLSIRPVLDMAKTDAVDQHDPPDWMRELVISRDQHCVFPHCGRDARACDLDHIDPYIPTDHGGPPGQTSPANLAPLCRRHHRCKTFTKWRYRRLTDGNYEWTDPTGHTSVAII